MYNKNWKRKRPFFFLLIPLGIAAFTAVVMLLWNAILPGVTGVTTITFWQALGILVLSKILFGGFGRGRSGHWRHRRHMKHRFMNMSEEEKAAYKAEWAARCRPYRESAATEAEPEEDLGTQE